MRLGTIEKILLAKQFKISTWLMEGCTALIQTWGTVPLEEIGTGLGWEVTSRIMDLVIKSRARGFDIAACGAWGGGGCRHIPSNSSHSVVSQADSYISCYRCGLRIIAVTPTGFRVTSSDLSGAIMAVFEAEFD